MFSLVCPSPPSSEFHKFLKYVSQAVPGGQLSREGSETEVPKDQKQAPCIPFLLPPVALNMLHPQRIIVFYQALPSPGPWSFRARKAVLGLWEKEKCSYGAEWGVGGEEPCYIFSRVKITDMWTPVPHSSFRPQERSRRTRGRAN